MPPKTACPENKSPSWKWVAMEHPIPAKVEGTTTLVKTFDLPKRRAEHWCWRPVGQPAPPSVHDAAWPRSPIDAFILQRIESAGLRPAPPADPRTLTRRLYLDLTGLPPTPQTWPGMASMARISMPPRSSMNCSPSSLRGKWARHWMDLVRYAETCGHEFDYEIPDAWRYRDYLIRAANLDLAYDAFIREHIAGDLRRNRAAIRRTSKRIRPRHRFLVFPRGRSCPPPTSSSMKPSA